MSAASGRARPALLFPIAFVGGAAALLFETLWYRAAGLAFGNGLWASSLVLSAFMAGLALGSGVAARVADRTRRPLRIYAAIELAIGASAAGLVAALPFLSEALAPRFAALRDTPALLNASRLVLAFVLLMIPATAMGATLPVMVRALAGHAGFAPALGRLYGWNTLGAVCGALVGEAWWIERFGLRGTSLAAAALNATAAAGALWLSRGLAPPAQAAAAVARARFAALPLRIWLAAFGAGAVFLALEVLWFRFLSAFVYGTAWVFAVMLATVLAGIGLGGLAGARWLDTPERGARAALAVALAAGATALLGYAGFGVVLEAVLPPGRAAASLLHVTLLAAPLMLPTALLSGLLFTALAGAARERVGGDGEATGYVALANTIGAALGSLVGGFLLLPWLGLEHSLWLLAIGYVGVALLAWRRAAGATALRLAAAFALVIGFALFPSGAHMRYLAHPHAIYHEPDSRVVRVREGPLETLVLLDNRRLGAHHHYRILTNAFSQATDHYAARRYMKAFVHLPAALHPEPRRALLVSYGIGSTARALVETASLESIDVVDISGDILGFAEEIYPEASNPLRDPRVRTFVEDGRFFLRTGAGRYDLITSEPSPPKLAGVVNLFTQEYFSLLREHLAPGGLVSYWLPIHDLSPRDARAVVGAFCNVFTDCTAWATSGLDWMLLGSRGDAARAGAADFARPWSDPATAAELRALGFERPEQLLATFVAGAGELRRRVGETPPLVDDFPLRLSHAPVLPSDVARSGFVRGLLDPARARSRFERSDFASQRITPELRDAALPWFEWEGLAQARLAGHREQPLAEDDLVQLLDETDLRTLPLWLLGSDVRELAIARAAGESPERALVLGIGALAERRYAEAAGAFARAPAGPRSHGLEILARCLSGDAAGARRVLARLAGRSPEAASNPRFRAVLERRCGVRTGEKLFHSRGTHVPR